MNTSLTLQDFQYYRDLSNEYFDDPQKYFEESVWERLVERSYTDEQIEEIRSFFLG